MLTEDVYYSTIKLWYPWYVYYSFLETVSSYTYFTINVTYLNIAEGFDVVIYNQSYILISPKNITVVNGFKRDIMCQVVLIPEVTYLNRAIDTCWETFLGWT